MRFAIGAAAGVQASASRLGAVAAASILLWATAVRAAVSCPSQPPAPGSDAKKLYDGIRQSAERSPFFEAAAMKSALTACTAEGDAEDMRVIYTFGDAARFEAHGTPGAGFSEDILTMDIGTLKQAVQILKRQEKTYGESGCGISWKKGEAEKPQEKAPRCWSSARTKRTTTAWGASPAGTARWCV